MSNKRLKAQLRVISEIQNQLLLQADRVGIKYEFGPKELKGIELQAAQQHVGSFLSERANLEYELQLPQVNEGEVKIKLERLGMYIKRAERLIDRRQKEIERFAVKTSVPEKKVVQI